MAGFDHRVRTTELYEKTTMVRVEKTGTADPTTPTPTQHPIDVAEAREVTTSKRVVPIAEPSEAAAPGAAGPCSPTTKMGWLATVTERSENGVSASERSQTKPKIQRVPDLLQQNHKDARLFKPEVVAIGPFHRHDPRLGPMEEYKMAAAGRFAAGTGHAIGAFYNKVRDVAGQARECYADVPPGVGEEAFADMMFFDGCFLLSFVELYTCNRLPQLHLPPHLLCFVMKDMFLLENQIPLAVLDALMSLKPDVKLTAFVDRVIGTSTSRMVPTTSFSLTKGWRTSSSGSSSSRDAAEEDPARNACHLLDLLRTRFLGPAEESVPYPGRVNWNAFRSGMELKEVGIKFKKSVSRSLRDVRFEDGVFHSWLSLPQLVVDDLTRTRFLNLIALEMCPDGRSDYGITSYLWLMDRIIDNPEDVRELRSRGVLLNELGSDRHAADLFNELATDLSPDSGAYLKVMDGINRHYNNKCRVSMAKMLNTHFSTPWTAIAFFAAVFLTILTVIQTIFTVWPRGH